MLLDFNCVELVSRSQTLTLRGRESGYIKLAQHRGFYTRVLHYYFVTYQGSDVIKFFMEGSDCILNIFR